MHVSEAGWRRFKCQSRKTLPLFVLAVKLLKCWDYVFIFQGYYALKAGLSPQWGSKCTKKNCLFFLFIYAGLYVLWSLVLIFNNYLHIKKAQNDSFSGLR